MARQDFRFIGLIKADDFDVTVQQRQMQVTERKNTAKHSTYVLVLTMRCIRIFVCEIFRDSYFFVDNSLGSEYYLCH